MTRIAFDIGGVISKHPDIFRDFARTLMAGGAKVYVITDMHDVAMIVETLRLNGFDFIPTENIRSADYAKHGEGCKAVLLAELRIDIFVDDFIGYVAVPGCPVRCLVMPDAREPYYHPTWKTVGSEGDFGRRTFGAKP